MKTDPLVSQSPHQRPHQLTGHQKVCRVTIALDPKALELIPDAGELLWLKTWVKDQSCVLDAVYVGGKTTPSEFTTFVRKIGFGPEVNAQVLISKGKSKKADADILVNYLKNTEVLFLIVSSHGRSGLNRLLMGSFAENVLASSPVPVLFLNQGLHNPCSVERVLFPTDFSPEGERALKLFLSELPNFTGELIFHHTESPPEPIAATGAMGVSFYFPENYWDDRRQFVERQSGRFMQICQKRGVRARLMLHEGVIDKFAAIETTAESERVDLIAMPSIEKAQHVFRAQRWPVWVCGPQAL